VAELEGHAVAGITLVDRDEAVARRPTRKFAPQPRLTQTPELE
jgi:hypothetical protein